MLSISSAILCASELPMMIGNLLFPPVSVRMSAKVPNADGLVESPRTVT